MNSDLKDKYAQINRKFLRLVMITLVFYGSVLASCLFVFKLSPQHTLAVSTTIFQFGVIGWGLGFMGAYFVRMEKKTDLSIELGTQTADLLKELRSEITPVIDDVKITVKDIRDLTERFQGKGLDELKETFNKVEDHMRRIRDRVERDTEPLKVKRREPVVRDGEVVS